MIGIHSGWEQLTHLVWDYAGKPATLTKHIATALRNCDTIDIGAAMANVRDFTILDGL